MTKRTVERALVRVAGPATARLWRREAGRGFLSSWPAEVGKAQNVPGVLQTLVQTFLTRIQGLNTDMNGGKKLCLHFHSSLAEMEHFFHQGEQATDQSSLLSSETLSAGDRRIFSYHRAAIAGMMFAHVATSNCEC